MYRTIRRSSDAPCRAALNCWLPPLRFSAPRSARTHIAVGVRPVVVIMAGCCMPVSTSPSWNAGRPAPSMYQRIWFQRSAHGSRGIVASRKSSKRSISSASPSSVPTAKASDGKRGDLDRRPGAGANRPPLFPATQRLAPRTAGFAGAGTLHLPHGIPRLVGPASAISQVPRLVS